MNEIWAKIETKVKTLCNNALCENDAISLKIRNFWPVNIFLIFCNLLSVDNQRFK